MFFFFIPLMLQITLIFSNAKSPLHSWNKTYLLMMYSSYYFFTQPGAQAHEPSIKSRTLLELSQPGAPNVIFIWCKFQFATILLKILHLCSQGISV